MGNPAQFSGSFVKLLKSQLNLNNQAYILTGSVDPSQTAQNAPAGSIYILNTGAAYVKQDSGSTTNWKLLPNFSYLNYESPKSPADGFQALVSDKFDSTGKINTGLTTGSLVNTYYGGYYALSCDKTKTVTTSGTSYTLNAAPSFTVTPGCIIYFNSLGVFATIATVTSQTTGTLDVALSSNQTGAACMVSQAVWTVDLTNYGSASSANRLVDFFPSTTISKIHVEYMDSYTSGSFAPTYTATANVVVAASNYGLSTDTSSLPTSAQFTSIFTRSTAPNQTLDYSLSANSNQQRLFLCFFPNPSNSTVTTNANLIGYDVSAYALTTYMNGGTLNSAYCMTDGSGTSLNCSAPAYNSSTSSTRVTLTWNYTPGINSMMPDGDVEVLVEGQVIPRYYSGVQGAYYTEVAGSTNAIDIYGNLTTLSPAQSIHIRRRQGITDTSAQNALRLLASFDCIVGSATQVATGQATHSSIQSAINTLANTNGLIWILPGTYTENPTLVSGTNDGIRIVGKGHGCVLNGNLTIGSNYCDFDAFAVNGNISVTGGGNFLKLWLSSTGSFTDSGSGNHDEIIQG